MVSRTKFVLAVLFFIPAPAHAAGVVALHNSITISLSGGGTKSTVITRREGQPNDQLVVTASDRRPFNILPIFDIPTQIQLLTLRGGPDLMRSQEHQDSPVVGNSSTDVA